MKWQLLFASCLCGWFSAAQHYEPCIQDLNQISSALSLACCPSSDGKHGPGTSCPNGVPTHCLRRCAAGWWSPAPPWMTPQAILPGESLTRSALFLPQCGFHTTSSVAPGWTRTSRSLKSLGAMACPTSLPYVCHKLLYPMSALNVPFSVVLKFQIKVRVDGASHEGTTLHRPTSCKRFNVQNADDATHV